MVYCQSFNLSYSYNNYLQTYSDKVRLISQITTHIKAVHKQGKSKHSLAREPSFKNHKNKKYI